MLFVEDMKIGMKVYPVSRTITSGKYAHALLVRPATHSVVWQTALDIDQPYLYVKGIDEVYATVECGLDMDEDTYDIFMDYDLEEYNGYSEL